MKNNREKLTLTFSLLLGGGKRKTAQLHLHIKQKELYVERGPNTREEWGRDWALLSNIVDSGLTNKKFGSYWENVVFNRQVLVWPEIQVQLKKKQPNRGGRSMCHQGVEVRGMRET